ncbi:MAG: cupin domain-containing protein [Acetobacteraceae bacterium]|jgi:uncharacterized cupin superfamily protein
MTSQIAVIAQSSGEQLNILGTVMVVKLDADGVFVAENVVPPGCGAPLHVHDAEDEIFSILEGELTLISEAGETKARPGDTVWLPRGVPHGFRNATEQTVRALVFANPGARIAAMFRQFDRACSLGPVVPERIGAICAEHGVHFQ